MAEKKIRAINFDLKTESLKKYYSSKSPGNAYAELAKFFYQNGFIHRQYSGYVSQKGMSNADIQDVIKDLTETFEWFSYCATVMDITTVEGSYNGLEIIEKLYQQADKTLAKPNEQSKDNVLNKQMDSKKR